MRRQRRSRSAWLSGREVDSMAGLANLADIMLVFACGLMVAIIAFWKVDLTNVLDVVDKSELQEVEDIEQAIQDGSITAEMENKGIAYQDPETGKMYIIMPGD